MATRLKTVHYAFPTLASLTNNTDTLLSSSPTVYLPESGKVFKSVVVRISTTDIVTATGGTVTTKTIQIQLGGSTALVITNSNTLTHSGENMSLHWSADVTSHFVDNWTGTSMVCNLTVGINQTTGTTLGQTNVCATIEITYEYDDTSATQIKSVFIPLNMPTGTLATTATTYDTIPALDTYLPEASKAFRQIFAVVQGNEQRNGSTTDHTMTLRIGATSVTTGNLEAALASDRFIRYVWIPTYPNTANTQTWQPTSSTTNRMNHSQAWLVVTYEYDEASTTSVMNSVMLPMEFDSPMGGTSSSDAQQASREFFIQEPGTITTNRIAFYAFWNQSAAIAGLNMRLGTGSYTSYTDIAALPCGSNAAMIRNDAAFTLARGRNNLRADVYRTDTTDFGWNMSGFWIINYTSGKSAQGTGAHNHTVFQSLIQPGTGAIASRHTSSAVSISIPETDYFITAAGTSLDYMSSGTVSPAGFNILVERLSGEGGVAWESAYRDLTQTAAEVGCFKAYSQVRTLFKRFPQDADTSRMDIEVARRWTSYAPGANSTAGNGWAMINFLVTYHTITYTVSGNLTGFSGTVDLELVRSNTNEILQRTSRVGDGSYSFTVYDNTESVYVTASDGTKSGRTLADVAAGSP